MARLRPGGRVRGARRSPRGHEVRAVGEDYVLTTVRDEIGVERVRLYWLEKG